MERPDSAVPRPDADPAGRQGAQLSMRLARWAAPGRDGKTAPKPLESGWSTDANAPADEVSDEATTMAAGAACISADTSSPNPPTDVFGVAPQTPQGPMVRWVEQGLHHVRLHAAPLSVAQAFSRYRKPEQAWVLTSATLSVHGDFNHFTEQLGLEDARTARWESPFDYASQALLFVPQGMPEPQSPQFTERFVQTLMPLLQASPGGALVLCTTLRAVERVAQGLADAFEQAGYGWPLLRQGDATRRELLDRFAKLDHPVLVGSASFWEGIDLPGEILTLVAIDKLPFAPPDDPVIEARLRACRAQGGNPFAEYQLPEAALALKQGAGRLIRTEQDWGVLMVGDARLVEKPYGKRLWRGLPPFARTRSMDEALAFYARRAQPASA